MTVEEFIEKIDNGRDILFRCMDKRYTILTWTEDGIFVGEQYDYSEKSHAYFKSSKDLVNNYRINGVPIKDIIDEVFIYQYA